MPALTKSRSEDRSKKRAEELFSALKDNKCRTTDRMFAWLIAFEWMAAMAAASLISPRVWPSEPPLQLVCMALALAGLIYLVPLYLALRYPGWVGTRHGIAV